MEVLEIIGMITVGQWIEAVLNDLLGHQATLAIASFLLGAVLTRLAWVTRGLP